jgi:hypothetical protein
MYDYTIALLNAVRLDFFNGTYVHTRRSLVLVPHVQITQQIRLPSLQTCSERCEGIWEQPELWQYARSGNDWHTWKLFSLPLSLRMGSHKRAAYSFSASVSSLFLRCMRYRSHDQTPVHFFLALLFGGSLRHVWQSRDLPLGWGNAHYRSPFASAIFGRG